MEFLANPDSRAEHPDVSRQGWSRIDAVLRQFLVCNCPCQNTELAPAELAK